MKKYTVVYGKWWNSGSHRHVITLYDYIETDNLDEMLKQDKYYGNVCFIFDGWCTETRDRNKS